MKQKKANKKTANPAKHTTPGSNASVIANKQNAEQNEAAASNKGDHLRSLFGILKRVNSNHIMALFTAGLFIASALQWWLTRETFRIGSRAYLGVKDAKIFQTGPVDSSGKAQLTTDFSRPKLGLSPVLEVKLVNTGATPAFDANGWAMLGLDDRPLAADPSYPLRGTALSSFISHQDVPKDAEMNFHGGRAITENERQEIMGGTKFLMIYGAVTYTDAFHSKHITKFCYVYQSVDDDMTACPGFHSMD